MQNFALARLDERRRQPVEVELHGRVRRVGAGGFDRLAREQVDHVACVLIAIDAVDATPLRTPRATRQEVPPLVRQARASNTLLAEVDPRGDCEAPGRRRQAPRAVAPVRRRAGVADLDRESQREPTTGGIAADARPRRAQFQDALVGRAHVVQRVDVDDLGPRPAAAGPAVDAEAYGLYAAALINPLPPLGVAPEVRIDALRATDSLARLRLVDRALALSLRHLDPQRRATAVLANGLLRLARAAAALLLAPLASAHAAVASFVSRVARPISDVAGSQ